MIPLTDHDSNEGEQWGRDEICADWMVDNQLKNPEITSKSANPRRPIERPLENRLDSPFMDSENPKKQYQLILMGTIPALIINQQRFWTWLAYDHLRIAWFSWDRHIGWRENLQEIQTNLMAKIPSGKFNIAIEHGPFIVDLPIENGGSFHRFLYVYQRVTMVSGQYLPFEQFNDHPKLGSFPMVSII